MDSWSIFDRLSALINPECSARLGAVSGGSLAVEDALFHLANALFLASYAAPTETGRGQTFLQTGLAAGWLLMATWAWNVACAPDAFVWYLLLSAVNSGQLLYIACRSGPIAFDEDLEAVYQRLFAPMGVSRAQFEKLLLDDDAEIVTLHTGERYAIENMTRTDRLALLISGGANVTSGRSLVHQVVPGEFLDSPEFESFSGGGDGEDCTFHVTVCAAVPSRCVVWQQAGLEYLLAKDHHLGSVVSALVSADVVKKLCAMNSRLERAGTGLDLRLVGIASKLSEMDVPQLERLKASGSDVRKPAAAANAEGKLMQRLASPFRRVSLALMTSFQQKAGAAAAAGSSERKGEDQQLPTTSPLPFLKAFSFSLANDYKTGDAPGANDDDDGKTSSFA